MACAQPSIENQPSTSTASATGTNQQTNTRIARFAMEGVGSRVIRGPDWKWNKQVRIFSYFAYFSCQYKENMLNK